MGQSVARRASAVDQPYGRGLAAQALKKVTSCEKINSAALGNVVRQLHFHVIARNTGDAGWPGPVWGFGARESYKNEEARSLAAAILEAL